MYKKEQSRMDNNEKQTTLGLDTRRRTKTNTTHKTKSD